MTNPIQLQQQDPRRPVNEFLPTGSRELPNSCTLFWRPNEAGGRTYISDEVACGTTVWDTALVSVNTLRAALEVEAFMSGSPETLPAEDALALRLAEARNELREAQTEVARLRAANVELETKLRMKEGAA